MKKILCLALVAIMMLGLVACGEKTPETNNNNQMNEAESKAFAESMEALGALDVETLGKYVANEAELLPIEKIAADEDAKAMWLAFFGKVKYLGSDNWFARPQYATTMFVNWYSDTMVSGAEMAKNTSELTKEELMTIFNTYKDKLSYVDLQLYPGDAIRTEGEKVYVDVQKLCEVLTGTELSKLVPDDNSTAHLEALMFGSYCGPIIVNTLESECYAPYHEFATLDLTKVADVVARMEYDFETPAQDLDKKVEALYLSHAAVYQKYYKDAEFVAKLQQFIETANVKVVYAQESVFLAWEGMGACQKDHVEQLNQINGKTITNMLNTALLYGTPDADKLDFHLYKMLVAAYLLENPA